MSPSAEPQKRRLRAEASPPSTRASAARGPQSHPALARDLWNSGEHLAGKVSEEQHDAPAEECEADRHHDELGHEAQRLLVDRRRRLDHPEQHARDERWNEDRCGGKRKHPQRMLGNPDIFVGAHDQPAAKEEASDPIVSAQPSTRTNRSSLNGIETIVGESIIMPRDMRLDATMRSMIRNGRKIRKPIWNAVFSSLVA